MTSVIGKNGPWLSTDPWSIEIVGILNDNARMQTSAPDDDIGFWSYGGSPQASQQQQGSAAMIQPPPQPAAPQQQTPPQGGALNAFAQHMQQMQRPPMQQPMQQPPRFAAGGPLSRGPRGGFDSRLMALSSAVESPGAVLRRPENARGRIRLGDRALLDAIAEPDYANLQAPRGRFAPPGRANPRLSAEVSPQRATFAHAGAVDGPGGGRDDAIDARLSDGEYVMDAESVALLGNGSNKAGAQALDQLRERLRAHKGGALTRGDFSPNARTPEAYLRGGR